MSEMHHSCPKCNPKENVRQFGTRHNAKQTLLPPSFAVPRCGDQTAALSPSLLRPCYGDPAIGRKSSFYSKTMTSLNDRKKTKQKKMCFSSSRCNTSKCWSDLYPDPDTVSTKGMFLYGFHFFIFFLKKKVVREIAKRWVRFECRRSCHCGGCMISFIPGNGNSCLVR